MCTTNAIFSKFIMFYLILLLKITQFTHSFSIQELKNALEESTLSPSQVKPAKFIYELLLVGINGSLKREWLTAVLAEIIILHMDIPSIILDVLNILDLETLSSNVTDERSNFCNIVKECEKVIPEKLMKERLEIDTLQDVGTLKNGNFYTKFIKIKTKL